jgi:drug/metabolite transporter (DMT)-like permease
MPSLYILLAIFLWSSLGIVVRFSGVDVHVLMFHSLLVAIVVQGAILSGKSYRHRLLDAKNKLKYPLLLGFVALVNTFTFFYAYRHTTISMAVLTHYTAPVIVAFIAPLFIKEKITRNAIAAIIIASAGLWIMLGGVSVTDGHLPGIAAGLISGVAYAFIIIILRLHSARFDSLVLVFLQNIVIALMLLPFVREMPPEGIWAYLTMGLLHSTIAPVLYFKGLKEVTANKAAILGYLEPVSAIVMGMIFLGEIPRATSIFGGILILFSGYLTLRKRAM